jgi:hypothetical protein
LTKNQIIEQLFTGKNFNDCIYKMDPEYLRDDLKMEVIAVICELPEEKILSLHIEGKLEFYAVKVIINMLTNKYSPFFKKFRITNKEYVEYEYWFYNQEEDMDRYAFDYDRMRLRHFTDSEHMALEEERKLREKKEDFALNQIDNLSWYSSTMLRLYMEKGNYRAMQRATGIPHVSCYKTVQKAINELKQRSL